MKRSLFILFFLLVKQIAFCQTIEGVVSEKFNPPNVTPNASGLDAANLIAEEFNKLGAFKCSKTLNTTLGVKIDDARNKFKDSLPKGIPIAFLCLVNKFDCKMIAIVLQTQTIRIKNNVCSVNDIKVESPDLIFDPLTTGFFSIKIVF
jgi:hypothetical protein